MQEYILDGMTVYNAHTFSHTHLQLGAIYHSRQTSENHAKLHTDIKVMCWLTIKSYTIFLRVQQITDNCFSFILFQTTEPTKNKTYTAKGYIGTCVLLSHHHTA